MTTQMSERGGQDPMSACYVRSNFPVTLMMAYKYADSPERAVLASANAGGENVNRNALLGAIMGAGHGRLDLLTKFLHNFNTGCPSRHDIFGTSFGTISIQDVLAGVGPWLV